MQQGDKGYSNPPRRGCVHFFLSLAGASAEGQNAVKSASRCVCMASIDTLENVCIITSSSRLLTPSALRPGAKRLAKMKARSHAHVRSRVRNVRGSWLEFFDDIETLWSFSPWPRLRGSFENKLLINEAFRTVHLEVNDFDRLIPEARKINSKIYARFFFILCWLCY